MLRSCTPVACARPEVNFIATITNTEICDKELGKGMHKSLSYWVGWDRRVEAQEKRGRRQEKRGWEAGVQWWRELGEIEKNFATFRDIL